MGTEPADDEVYCRDCGAIIKERAEICPECGIRQREPETSNTVTKDSGLAAIISFFVPGGGQIYNGQIGKGLVMLVAFVFLAITVVGLVIAIPLWVWGIYDAYKVAENGGASSSSSGGGGSPPRLTMQRALAWEAHRSDESERAESVRKRFLATKTGDLSEEDREYIMEVVEEYERETGKGSADAVREAIDR